MSLLVLQLILPIGLLIWLVVNPLNSLVGLLVQICSTAALLLAIAWAGMWLFPPWWTPHLLGAFWVAAVAIAIARRWGAERETVPSGWTEQAAAIGLLLVGSYSIYLLWDAAAGRMTSDAESVDLQFPLRNGTFLVLSGGSTETVNAHVRTLRPTTESMVAYRGQSYGVDIVKLGSVRNTSGRRKAGKALSLLHLW